ncbi:MAG: DUF4831 family protein [Bacteroidaceae bacterium]|nr:DUF4831 family protein [Bacteroidaceae bacterium]
MIKKITVLLLILQISVFNFHLFAQMTEFRPGLVADGVNYALPLTGVKADITAQKIVYTPGEFAKYADRYLHVQNVEPEASVTWKIVNMDIYQYGEPDTLKYYTVKMKDKSVAPMAQLTDNGILVSINTKVDIPTHSLPQSTTTHHKLDGKKHFTAEILAATSTSKMAELAAQEIFDIRESKNAIKRGQVESMPKDGASLKIVLDELDEQENALMQLFVGYRDTTTVSESYSIVPLEDIEKYVLFRFSKRLGFVDEDDLAGEPYYISIKDQHTVPMPTELEAKKRKITGIVYNMPSTASVRIFNASSTLFDKDLPFGQFGTVDVLNATLFGKDATTTVTFNPATGGLMHITK